MNNILVDVILFIKIVREIILIRDDKEEFILLIVNDLVFVINGSIIESLIYGDNDYFVFIIYFLGGSWILWKNLVN